VTFCRIQVWYYCLPDHPVITSNWTWRFQLFSFPCQFSVQLMTTDPCLSLPLNKCKYKVQSKTSVSHRIFTHMILSIWTVVVFEGRWNTKQCKKTLWRSWRFNLVDLSHYNLQKSSTESAIGLLYCWHCYKPLTYCVVPFEVILSSLNVLWLWAVVNKEVDTLNYSL